MDALSEVTVSVRRSFLGPASGLEKGAEHGKTEKGRPERTLRVSATSRQPEQPVLLQTQSPL